MLSAVTVDNNLDVVNGNTSSIAALIASNGGDGISLREALTAANNTAGADTIGFAAGLSGSTITLGGTNLLIADAVTINGLGASLLTIDANQGSRVFDIDNNNAGWAFVEISGLTLTGGQVSGIGTGGGIRNYENLWLTNVTISDNDAYRGGGIDNAAGLLTVKTSTISGNSSLDGGGIRNVASARVISSTVAGNTASSQGGGIFNTSTGALWVVSSTVSGNSSTQQGGGIFESTIGGSSIINSTISGNSAGTVGGGIYRSSGTLTLTNSTITGNSAAGNGGGLFIGPSLATIANVSNNVISGNSAGGAGDEIYRTFGTVHVSTSNVLGHSGLTNADAFQGLVIGLGDITATSDGNDPTALSGIINTTLANNGGPTLTHALVNNSPALDSGTLLTLPLDLFDLDGDGNTTEVISVDQRGLPFARAYGTIDIGAIERQALTINGTTGNDIITVALGASFVVTVNGVQTTYNPAFFQNRVEVHGLAGNDTLYLIGTSGVEDTTLNPTTVSLVGAGGMTATGDGFETIDVTSGGGEDRAFLYDSAGNDTFYATPTLARMQGTGYVLTVNNYRRAYAYSYTGGFDTADLHGSAGLDNLNAEDIRSTLSSTNYYNSAIRFEQVNAYGNTADDSATLWDSTGVDILSVAQGLSSLSGTGFNNRALSFNRIYAYSYAGGIDEAYFYDTSADDFFVGKDVRSTIQNPDVTYYGSATRFEKVYAYASGGTNDRADLYGNANSDTLVSGVNSSTMSASDYYYQVNSFETVNSYAGAGGTDTADLSDSSGNDWFLDIPTSSYVVWGNNNRVSLFNFNTVDFESLLGGFDYAEFRSLGTLDEVYGLDALASVERTNGRVVSATGIDEVIAQSLAAPGPILNLNSIDYIFTQTGVW